jgi:hypothetical protein
MIGPFYGRPSPRRSSTGLCKATPVILHGVVSTEGWGLGIRVYQTRGPPSVGMAAKSECQEEGVREGEDGLSTANSVLPASVLALGHICIYIHKFT